MKSYEEIKEYINSLKSVDGYVRFSHRDFERKDIFENSDVNIDFENENGFIIEAFFFDGKRSISIKNFNDKWFIDEVIIEDITDFDEYLTKIEHFDKKLRVIQIWEDEKDEMCEGFRVKKLKKLLFGGFIRSKK